MAKLHAVSLRLAILLSLVATAGCGDSPVTPDDIGAQQGSTAAMFAEIIDKLESIEQRIDSLEAAVDASGGDSLALAGLPAAQLDSVLALASFLAVDATTGSVEFCAGAQLAGEFGTQWIGEAEGEGAGHLGAWAGTGAYAGGKITAKAEVAGGFKVEGAGGVEFCHPGPGGDAPPVRPTPAGPMRSPEVDQLRTTLTALTTQFNLTPATLSQSLTGISTAIASPGSLSLQSVGGHLPLPPALAGISNDPLGTVAGGVQNLMSNAQSKLCTSNPFSGPVATVISDACGVINSGGLANITALADMASTYPVVETAVRNVCTRVNSIGLQRLIIPSWDVTFPLGIGTVNVFPGYNQRLFAAYTTVPCP